MGGCIEKGHPLPVQFPLPLHLAPERLVGALQLCQGSGEFFCHCIQAAAQLPDLVPARFAAFPVKVQLGHLPSNIAHPHNGPGKVPGIKKGAQQRKGQQHQQKPRGHLYQRPHRHILRFEPWGDIECIALLPPGKAHLRGDG